MTAVQRECAVASRTRAKNRFRAVPLEADPEPDRAADPSSPWQMAALSELGGAPGCSAAGRGAFADAARRAGASAARARELWEALGDEACESPLAIPGIGPKTAAAPVTAVGISLFGSHREPAGYRGAAPADSRSGTSIRSTSPQRGGNKQLKNLLIFSCNSLAAVGGCQDRIVLGGRVWIDEVYVNDTELSKGCGQARKRGPSKEKLRIAIAIDASKTPVAFVCGHGKPSTKRIRAALGSHLEEGGTVVHDKERAHNGAIADKGCASEAYKADVGDPAYLEAMKMVNNLSSWLKRHLRRFTGVDPANLQSYLDWFVYLFRALQAQDRWPKAARAVRHLIMADATYRT